MMLAEELPAAGLLLLNFAIGYLAVNAVPGPNMLAIGTQAALRGLRGVMPVCLGVASGAAALAAALHLAFGILEDLPTLERAGRAVGGMLLLVVAARALLAPRPAALAATAGSGGLTPRASLLAFAAGFATGVSNPVTAAYFLAQFVGPLAEAGAGSAAVLLVLLQALAWTALVGIIFAQPAARRLALAHHRLVCTASALALAALALAMLRPLLPLP